MNRSRRRQFDQFRSHANSVRDQTSSKCSSKVSKSTVSEACVNCINLIMADRHKKADKDQKQKVRAQFRKSYQLANSWVDDQNNYRNNMKKQALEHNAKMIQAHEEIKKYERQQNLKEGQKMEKLLAEAVAMNKQQQEAQKKRYNQYYQQMQKQYLNELEKKDKQKMYSSKVQKADYQGLPLANPDLTQQKLKYRRDLQRQMQQRKIKQIQQKQKNQQKQRQCLQQSKRQADRYHADNYQSLKMSKKQVFQGLKNLQQQKRQKIQNERKTNQDNRMKQIRQQNDLRSKAIKMRMDQMQNYVRGLKQQLLQRQAKLKQSKMYDSSFTEKLPKSTQQLQSQLQMKKTCKSCFKDYPQQYIGPVPKKA